MTTTRVFLFFFLIFFTLICSSSSLVPIKTARIYVLKKGNFSMKLTNFGATILSVILPDSNGDLADVALGYKGIHPYINGSTNFGALIGRVANRIAGARFVLNGTLYKLYPNDGNNSIHGGLRGFSRVFWDVKEKKLNGEFPYITFNYYSFDGDQGFPGDLDVEVTYKLSGPYELSVNMSATPRTKATPVNLAQHNYWNLGGHNSGTILSNKVQIFASNITPVDKNLIPNGSIVPVSGTPYDFLEPRSVGSRINETKGGGYDINYVVNGGRGMKKVAIVKDEKSGRQFELWANQPGVQFYTGNFLDHVEGKGGVTYEKYDGLCLETQGFPDSLNHPQFPSQIVNPGQVYKHDIIFKFSF